MRDKITQEEVSDVEFPDKKFDKWSDEELMKLFFDSWSQINVTDCFGMKDLLHEQEAMKRLVERGYEVDQVDGEIYR